MFGARWIETQALDAGDGLTTLTTSYTGLRLRARALSLGKLQGQVAKLVVASGQRRKSELILAIGRSSCSLHSGLRLSRSESRRLSIALLLAP